MKKIFVGAIFIIAVLISLTVYAFGLGQSGTFHAPADFEPQAAVWVSWPSHYYRQVYIDDKDVAVEQVTVDMVKALDEHVKVKMVVLNAGMETRVRNKLESQEVDMTKVEFIVMPYADTWTRDWGPIYVANDLGGKKIVDFGWNSWGLPEGISLDELRVQDDFAPLVAVSEGLETIHSDIVSEGGDRNFNGKGTMLAVEKTELQRNPGYTLAQLEAEYARTLGVRKVIWMKRGVVEDNTPNERVWPGPGGQLNAYTMGAEHIDEFARFASPNVILLSEVTAEEAAQDSIAAENRKRLEANYNILTSATDQDNKKFTIIRVPAAEVMYYRMDKTDGLYQWVSTMTYDDGSIFPAWPAPVYDLVAASYMNFVVSNGVVLVQQYWKPGMSDIIKQKDASAMKIIGNAFPGREIVGIDAFDLDINSGGIHCATQEEPAV